MDALFKYTRHMVLSVVQGKFGKGGGRDLDNEKRDWWGVGWDWKNVRGRIKEGDLNKINTRLMI